MQHRVIAGRRSEPQVPVPTKAPRLSMPLPCDFTQGARCYISSSSRARLEAEAR